MSAGYDDDRRIVMTGPGWERLPDGSYQFLADAPTLVHYVTLPKDLFMGDKRLHKSGWHSDRKLAFYLDTLPQVLEARTE
jgi:hypothetical protein